MGACLIGGTSAVLAAKTTPGRQISALASTNQIATGSTPTSSSGSATASFGKTTPTSGESVSPTATTIGVPTATRAPTPTPQVGQTIQIGGDIRSISTNPASFSLHRLGVTTIIDVSSTTTYSGVATSFSQLQVGLGADVICVVQADRSCLASHVNTDQ